MKIRTTLELDTEAGTVTVVSPNQTPTDVVFAAGGAAKLSDPSNAPAGYPSRSPGGYPLQYAIGGDGKPVGAPRLLYDGQTFESEAAIDDYKVRAPARDQALADEPAEEAAKYVGKINPDEMGLYDWAFWQKRGLYKLPGNYAIFMKKPVVRDPADGRVLQNPETELAGVDVSAYGGPLAQFV